MELKHYKTTEKGLHFLKMHNEIGRIVTTITLIKNEQINLDIFHIY